MYFSALGRRLPARVVSWRGVGVCWAQLISRHVPFSSLPSEREDGLSSEARRYISMFPDVSYMLSNVLVMPA
jgi:hypothetical protein